MLANLKIKLLSQYKNFKKQDNKAILLRGASASFITKVFGLGLAFVMQVFAARILNAGGYGQYAYVLAWVNTLVLLGRMGFDSASVRFIASYNGAKEWGLLHGFLRYSTKVISIASVTIALGMGIVVWLLRGAIEVDLFQTFLMGCLLLPLLSAIKIQESRLLAFKKIIQAQFPFTVLRPFCIIIGIFLLSLLERKIDSSGFMMIVVVATAIALCLTTYWWRKEIPKEVLQAKVALQSREWLQTGRAMIFVAGFQVVLAQSDTVMIGTLVGDRETGLYAIANRLSSLLIFVLVAFNSALSPLVADLYTQRKRRELQKIVNKGVNLVFLLTLIPALVLIFGNQLILSLFGQEFLASRPILLVLIIGQITNASAGPVSLLLNMTGHHDDTVKVMGVTALNNIVLNGILIPQYGAIGAAAATSATTILWNVAMVILVWHRLKIISVACPKALLPKLSSSS